MKQLLLTLTAMAGISGWLHAQAPSGFSYQAVVRNSSGQPLPNQNVALRFTIRDASSLGSIIYQETQSKTTNAQGLIQCNVGSGTAGLGSYPSAAQLASGLKFLQVEIDPVGGTSYAEISNTQLMSVPYANYANAAGTANSLNSSATVNPSQITAGGAGAGQVLKWNGSAWVPSRDDTTVISAGTGITISGGVINTPWTSNGNHIFNNNAGNVGIGTSTPGQNLEVTDSTGNSTIMVRSIPVNASSRLQLEGSGSSVFSMSKGGSNTGSSLFGWNTSQAATLNNSGGGSMLLVTADSMGFVAGGAERIRITKTGIVGIGTSNPTNMAKLNVHGYGITGVYPYYLAGIVADGDNPSISSSGIYGVAGWRGVIGHNKGTAGGNQAIGVYGLQEGRSYNSGYGVLGEVKGNGPRNYGVYGQSDSGSTLSVGVFGISNSRVSGFSAGVYGKGSHVGVYGNSGGVGRSWTNGIATLAPAMVAQQRSIVSGRQSALLVHSAMNGSSSHTGLVVLADSSTGANYAIESYVRNPNSTTAINYGMYATLLSGGSPSSYAGYFGGNLYATSASSSIKAFKIDHPQDPENKYLYHSSVESPDMMNIYNGNVVTDANGDATITLPGYFSSLNIDFKYQLTCIGQFAQAIVAQEISDGTFKIKTDKPNVKVSWQVTGVRNDPVAQKYRVQTEVEKPAGEKGFYLMPDVYGFGPEKNAAWYRSSQNTNLKYEEKPMAPELQPATGGMNQRQP